MPRPSFMPFTRQPARSRKGNWPNIVYSTVPLRGIRACAFSIPKCRPDRLARDSPLERVRRLHCGVSTREPLRAYTSFLVTASLPKDRFGKRPPGRPNRNLITSWPLPTLTVWGSPKTRCTAMTLPRIKNASAHLDGGRSW